MKTAEEIYEKMIDKGTIHFPQTKQQVISAMKAYAKQRCEQQKFVCTMAFNSKLMQTKHKMSHSSVSALTQAIRYADDAELK